MSKLLRAIVFPVLLAAAPLYAQGVNWRSWESALDEVKRTDKMIMMDVIRDNCRYCTRMDKAVFDNAEMAAYIEKNFIPVKVNLSHSALPMGLKVEMTPTFFFFTAKMRLIKKLPGSWDLKDFREFTDTVIAENNTKDAQ